MHNTPATTVTFARRSALESISDTLEQYIYEEVPPASIKAARPAGDGGDEYLIEWLDGVKLYDSCLKSRNFLPPTKILRKNG